MGDNFLSGIVALGTELLKYVNKPEAVRTIKELDDLRKKIDEEKAKGQLADYGRIETWLVEAKREETKLLLLLAAKGAS